MKEAVVGFDSAWAGNESGAICYAIIEGDTIKVNIPRLSDFADAAEMVKVLERECDHVLVAIDQPIIVPNYDSGRPVDSVAKSFMVRLGSSAQVAKRRGKGNQEAMFGDSAPIWKFINRIGPTRYRGRTTDSPVDRAFVDFEAAKTTTSGKIHMIEVYPAMALPALESVFDEGEYAAKYNPSRSSFSQNGWQRVCKTVEKRGREIGLDSLSKWANEMIRPWDSPDKPKKLHQDKIDAALCLIVALQWKRCRRKYGMTVIGDLKNGYIVTPMGSPQTSTYVGSLFKRACYKFGVPIRSVIAPETD